MSPGDLVHLTETAHLSVGIDPQLDLCGIVLKPIDFREVVSDWRDNRPTMPVIRGSVTCYKVLLSDGSIEMFYEEDLEILSGKKKDGSN